MIGAVRSTYVPCSELKLDLAFNPSLAGLVASTRSGSYMSGMNVGECFVVGPEPGHELKRRAPSNMAFEYRERWQEVLLTAPDFLPASVSYPVTHSSRPLILRWCIMRCLLWNYSLKQVLGFSLGERKAIWMRDFECVDDEFMMNGHIGNNTIPPHIANGTGSGSGVLSSSSLDDPYLMNRRNEDIKRQTIDDMQRSALNGSPKLLAQSRGATESPVSSMHRRRGTERKMQVFSTSLQGSPSGSPVITPLPSLSPKAGPPQFGLNSGFGSSPTSHHPSSFFNESDLRKGNVTLTSATPSITLSSSLGSNGGNNNLNNNNMMGMGMGMGMGSAPQSPQLGSNMSMVMGSSGSSTRLGGGSVTLAKRAMATGVNTVSGSGGGSSVISHHHNRQSLDRGTSAHRSSSRGSGRSTFNYNPDSPNTTTVGSLGRDTSSGSRRGTATSGSPITGTSSLYGSSGSSGGGGGGSGASSRFPQIRGTLPSGLPPLAGATPSTINTVNNGVPIPSKRSVVIPAKPRAVAGMNRPL
jgi:hypothetical protein